MERYSMLIAEEESPGLRIIQTEAYRDLIGRNPGLIHENCGDFYSDIPVNELSEAVYKALDREFIGTKLNRDIVIVDASTFNPDVAEMEKNYLVREVDGIRIYAPKLHIPEAEYVSQSYGLFGLMFIGDLFFNERQGSLQVSLRKLEERFQPMLEKLKTKSA